MTSTPLSPSLGAPLWSGALEVGDLYACGSHDVEHQQSEAEAVKASVELVAEGLLGNTHLVRFKPAAQLLVRQVLVAAEIEHQRLGVQEVNLLVCGTQWHQEWQIVYELASSYRRFFLAALNNSFTRIYVDAGA